MHILYVTNSRHGQRAWLDPSARHRVYHYADALTAAGCRVQVVHVENITATLVRNFKHIIFHRPKSTDQFKAAFELCRQSQAMLHADYDDLIFDADYAEFSPMYLNGNRPLSKVVEYFQRNYEAATRFTSFLVSTRYLSGGLKKCFPEAVVSILPNSLPLQFEPPEWARPSTEQVTIGYFPGSNSHGHDLNMVADALSRSLGKSKRCRFVVAGQLNRDDVKSKNLKIEFLPYMDYRKYLSLLSRVNVSIAPLESNPFNAAKSAVKLIESVAVGTPILVSENQDMIDHQNTLSTVVEKKDGWESALDRAIEQAFSTDRPIDESLKTKYRVDNRLPLLTEHLQCTV